MDSPNVLLLDEPTNDFDVETLTALEDLLDSFAGTLLVISHDRYFLERVCDRFVGLTGDKAIRDLPRGIDEYLELRFARLNSAQNTGKKSSEVKQKLSIVEEKALKKEIARIEKQMERRLERIEAIKQELDTHATDYAKLAELNAELENLQSEHAALEEEWLALNV